MKQIKLTLLAISLLLPSLGLAQFPTINLDHSRQLQDLKKGLQAGKKLMESGCREIWYNYFCYNEELQLGGQGFGAMLLSRIRDDINPYPEDTCWSLDNFDDFLSNQQNETSPEEYTTRQAENAFTFEPSDCEFEYECIDHCIPQN